MRWSFAACLIAVGVTSAQADELTNPFRLIPKQADVALRIEPGKLVDAVRSLPKLAELAQFPSVREALDSTNSRRFVKFVQYYEKELGAPWPELLQKLAGGGIVVATKFAPDGDLPVLAVVQSRDAELLKRAVALVSKVAEQELKRNDSPLKPSIENYRDIQVTHYGDAYYAIAGSAFLIANKEIAIQKALDLHLNGAAESLANESGPADAAKLLDPNPLVSLWVNLKPAQESPQGKEAFRQPRSDIAQMILAGGVLDVFGKAQFVAAGVYKTPDGFTTSVRLPAGRDATANGLGLHLAPADQAGSLPLLEPANVLYSSSFYLDLGALWNQRETLLTESARKQIDKAEKQVGRFLAGRKLSELLTQSGPYHRFVVVAQTQPGYTKKPAQLFPAIAVASTMRDSGFGEAMNAILRTVAFLTGTQAKLKLVEETVDGVKLVGYRFPEDGTLPGDTQNLRFNASPCFAIVGDQFFAASTIELGREMIGVLKHSPPSAAPMTTLTAQSRAYAAGGAALAKIFEDQQLTQTLLERAVSVDEARKEVEAGIEFLSGLGVLKLETDFRPHEFRFDIRWEAKK
ncbi:MAG TPA: hypothetical protein VGH90_07445 [Chthoniobacteraceae bacterium]|jgi:hypothetical protein